MSEQTRLWVWFIFNSGLRPPRAKALLARWQAQGANLAEVLAQLPQAAGAWGLTPDEAQALHPLPPTLPDIPAVRWDEPGYPRGLKRRLQEVMRPALLFITGSPALLGRPLVYLPPEDLEPEAQEQVRETAGMLVGESVLPAVFEGSPVEKILLEELSCSEGEVLLWLRGGSDSWQPNSAQRALLDQGRLIALTPLPPPAPPIPEWMPFLEQVALAAADFVLYQRGVEEVLDGLPRAHYHEIDRLEQWLETLDQAVPPGTAESVDDVSPAPLDSEELLARLEKIGRVPAKLRQRLKKT